MSMIPLETIRAARERIAPYIRPTPILPFDALSRKTGKEILVKAETFQKTGSFKIRGAANCILENLAQAKKCGVTAASAGNHAQAVAAICHVLGIRATVVMPANSPMIKVQNTQSWGATVELVGTVYDEAEEHAYKLAKEHEFLFIHPFLDPKIMAGQGTIGLELAEDPRFKDVEAVVIAVGGGGLISGCASALKALKPGIKVYGVTAKNAPAAWKSFHTGKASYEPVAYTLAEGVAAKRCDQMMVGYLKASVDDVFSVPEESIAHAISLLAEHGKMVVEGAGAISVAAVLEGQIPEKNLAIVVSGGNIDLPALSSVLQRGLVEQGRLARLTITISDRPGGLLAATQVLAEKQANILQVFHKRTTLHAMGEAEIEVDIETKGRQHTDLIMDALAQKGFLVKRGE